LVAGGVVALALVLGRAEAGPNDLEIPSDTTVSADLVVPKGSVCTVRPGITIRFAGYHSLIVRGVIIAEGTADSPIRVTTTDRPRGSAAPPSWKGLEILEQGAYGRFRHCRIEGAFRNLVWNTSASFDSCEFVGNHYGLYSARGATPHVRNCRFYRNCYGVVADMASPLLLDNTITDNTCGLYLLLSSEGVVGRNVIEGNTTDIESEQAFGSNRSSLSLHYLWKVMSQLY
jgi:parallel beta-helix repeat protein